MPRYVNVAVYFPQVLGTFDYHVPDDLVVQVGQLVEVPFGRENRPMQGVVLRFVDAPAVSATKPILDIVDPEAVLTPTQIALAEDLSHHYLHPLAQTIALMLPPGVARLSETEYRLTPQAPPSPPEGPAWMQRLWVMLREEGPLRTGQIRHRFPRNNWEEVLEGWMRRGWVARRAVLPSPRVRPGITRQVSLRLSPEALEDRPLPGRPDTAAYTRRQAVVDLLKDAWPDPVDVDVVYAETGATAQDLAFLEKHGWIVRRTTPTWRDPLAHVQEVPETPPHLTPDQEQVWARLEALLHQALVQGKPVAPVLLHGVTGSGKTELYLRAAAWTLERGRQVLVLVPEIGLAAHVVRRFLARFGRQVGLLHSGMPLGHRYDTWRRARRGEIAVLIGTRSAAFAPLPHLGLIVVDECHADAYANPERGPYYHAREVALHYARLVRGVALLGSATPDVTTYAQARTGQMYLLRLPQRVYPRSRLPQVEIVDMRAVWKTGQGGALSAVLLDALDEALRRGEQALLFLNRRGTMTHVFCRECGHVFACPRCRTPLVYHASLQRLMCHHCGYRRNWPRTCPQCQSTAIAGIGWGTERLEAEIRHRFPQARVFRWDRDTAFGQDEVDILLEHFRRGEADVLIGTQVLAKGLDLPNVTLVGVVLADIGLTLPDYRAAERTFQVLTQVIGRAGRREKPGRAIIQTYMPDHYALRAAAAQDYDLFFHEETARRRRLGYPPFARLVRLEYRDVVEERAKQAAEALAQQLRAWIRKAEARATTLIGPVPCFFSPLAGWHRWHIILRGPDPTRLLRDRYLPPGWRIQVDPVSLL